jgi:polyhydroxybutyrate depolymerase
VTRRARVAALTAALVIGLAGLVVEPAGAGRTSPRRPARSEGCGAQPAAPPGMTHHVLTWRGIERVYETIVPEGYDGTRPLPIVLGLHPLSIPHTVVPSIVGFADAAEEHDFIAVVPAGRRNGPTPFWNAAPQPHNDDVSFIADVLDDVEAQLCVDTSRVFSTGMSNGGHMSSILACQLSKRITAVAPIAGAEFYEQCKGRPVPVVAFHGDADPIVTYEGGGLNATEISRQQLWRGEVPPGLPKHDGVDGAMRRWAEHNGCNKKAKETRVSDEVLKRTWSGCKASTTLYVIEGGGHAWPGTLVPGFEDAFGKGTTDINATKLAFDLFFSV